MDFHYAGKARVPKAMTLRDGRETCLFALGCDQVGSITTVANDAGDLVKTVLYDAFGNVVDDSAPHFFLPLTFAGGAQDRWTGLMRFGHRDYDPQSGRFTARDPSHSPEGDPDTYEFASTIRSTGLTARASKVNWPSFRLRARRMKTLRKPSTQRAGRTTGQ